MSTSADVSAEAVSAAILVFTGWGVAKTPRADEAAVAGYARQAGVAPEALLEEVLTAIAVSENVDMSGVDLPSPDAGPHYKALLAGVRPDLAGDAVDALASRWFYRRIWLGADTPRAADVSPTRYYALFAPRGAERVPRALFRRRVVDTLPVDEVLRDVDTWDADSAGRVEKAVTRYLDSDLEEISAEQAAQFEQMVRAREYRPFTG